MVSVLMPVYNGEKYLREAIKSILNQTFTNFEFIIINDGSTDNSLYIIKSFKDNRIKIIENKENLGLIKTLNKGINLAQGKYIARMDADDIALPKRLEKQIEFLEKNPKYSFVGTRAKYIYNNSNTATINEPFIKFEEEEILFWSFFYCPFVHPSILIHKNILEKYYYNNDYKAAEDYHLWVTLLLNNNKGTNINEVLMLHRMHNKKIGVTQKQAQLNSLLKIYKLLFDFHQIHITQEELNTHLLISNSYNHQLLYTNQLKSIEKWLQKLQEQLSNTHKIAFPEDYIKTAIANVLYMTHRRNKSSGLSSFKVFIQSDLIKYLPNKSKKILLLFLHIIGHSKIFYPIYQKVISILRKILNSFPK
jgi:glycosyltransferase involved in cell wall biosynthesis